jgi:O-antigen/teichoic acid export membrane protein
MQEKINTKSSLSSGSTIFKNSVWNLTSQVMPMLVGLFSIPLLIKGMGLERFGLLALAWVAIGYFSLFDFGLGRALTKLVSERIGLEDESGVNVVSWTALAIMFAISAFGSLILSLIIPLLIDNVLTIPEVMKREAEISFYLLAGTIPIVVITSGLRGILEAYQRFDLVAFLRIPMGVWTFLGPLVALSVINRLEIVVLSLVIGRLIIFILYYVLCRYILGSLKAFKFDSSIIKSLFTLGGWMTVTNVVGPMMVYFDRFFIGAFLPLSAVTYYTTPNEIVTRLTILPASVASVLFAAFSLSLITNKTYAYKIFERGVFYVFILIYPIVLFIFMFSAEALTLWINADFSNESANVLRWLSIGILFNSLARIPFAFIQADGRPDITAKLHMLELPLYVLLLWAMLTKYGIDGVAVTWMLRSSFDAIILFYIAEIRMKSSPGFIYRIIGILTIGIVVIYFSTFITSSLTKVISISVFLLLFYSFSWFVLLNKNEKKTITGYLSISGIKKHE